MGDSVDRAMSTPFPHNRIIFLVVLILSLIPSSVAFACTPALPTIVASCEVDESLFSGGERCLDDRCEYEVKPDPESLSATIRSSSNEYIRASLTPNEVRAHSYGLREELMQIFDLACTQDLSGLLSELRSHKWATGGVAFHSGDILIEPYSPERLRAVTAGNWQLLSCSYTANAAAEGWMASRETLREYCHATSGLVMLATYCGGTSAWLSILPFMHFLITDLNLIKAAYLFIFIVPAAFMALAIVDLKRRRKLLQAIRPTRKSVGSMLFLLLLFGCVVFWVAVEALLYWLLLYFPLSIAGYYLDDPRASRHSEPKET